MVATMHRLAAMLVSLLCCFLFIATLKAQQQPQPAASDNTASPPSCVPHERDALLAFKHGITAAMAKKASLMFFFSFDEPDFVF